MERTTWTERDGSIKDGEKCNACGTSYEACTRKLRGGQKVCCAVCQNVGTHDERTIKLPNEVITSAEDLRKGDLVTIKNRVTGATISDAPLESLSYPWMKLCGIPNLDADDWDLVKGVRPTPELPTEAGVHIYADVRRPGEEIDELELVRLYKERSDDWFDLTGRSWVDADIVSWKPVT